MIALLLHAFYSTALAFLLSSLFGHLNFVIAVVSLALGTWLGRSHARRYAPAAQDLRLRNFSGGEVGAVEALLFVVVGYACLRHFAWLFFVSDHKWMTLSANNFGDLPLHINYIRSLAKGLAFPIANPSFASEPLRYPFGPDLYNALWEIVGVPLRSHLFLTGIAATAIALVILRWFGSWWAIGGFFLSGGIIGFVKVKTGVEPQSIVDWKNLLLSVWITQRGMLFALPAGLLIIELWRRHVSGESRLQKNAQTSLGLVWGLLPLFHAHAFFTVSIILFGLSLIELGRKGVRELFSSRLFSVAALPAFYFVWRTTNGFQKSAVAHWDAWWTSNAKEAPGFIWVNFGFWIFVPIAIGIALRLLPEPAKKRAWRLGFALSLFVLFFNLMLAPWAWDNIKILIWPFLMIAQLANETVDRLLPKFIRYVIAAALFGTGFMAIAGSFGQPSQKGLTIYHVRDLNWAEGALARVSPAAVFVAAPTHEHPLTYFGGLRVLGYEGHLWSHGIKADEVRTKQDAIMNGSQEYARLMRELGATHIFYGAPEKAKYGENPRPWMTELENVSNVPDMAIYRLPDAGGSEK